MAFVFAFTVIMALVTTLATAGAALPDAVAEFGCS
jgi:hypothetical protein